MARELVRVQEATANYFSDFALMVTCITRRFDCIQDWWLVEVDTAISGSKSFGTFALSITACSMSTAALGAHHAQYVINLQPCAVEQSINQSINQSFHSNQRIIQIYIYRLLQIGNMQTSCSNQRTNLNVSWPLNKYIHLI